MKKIISMMAIAIALSACSKDDDNSPQCTDKIWQLSAGSSPGEPIVYYVRHGATDATAPLEVTNQATFDYYSNVPGFSLGRTCWEGAK